jgi:hypothetical protein
MYLFFETVKTIPGVKIKKRIQPMYISMFI